MTTVIVIDGVAHAADPEEENQTLCGLVYDRDSADAIVSGARYIDDLIGEVSQTHDTEICDECYGQIMEMMEEV